MDVQFCKTGERRYAVTILRQNQPSLEMNPAPGYDPLMPHDLLHFIVESELGLRQGIYGQIASGGTAGTFHTASDNQPQREAARLRRRAAKRGKKLLQEGRQEADRSEQATYLCLYAWLSRSPLPENRNRAQQMKPQAQSWQAITTSLSLNETMLARICARMDELSSQWSALKIGEAMTVKWPQRA